jgi:hypothetical protein
MDPNVGDEILSVGRMSSVNAFGMKRRMAVI